MSLKKEQNSSRLYFAAKFGDLKRLGRLISRRIDLHSDFDCALVISASFGHLEFTENLLQLDSDVRAHNHQALKSACENNDIEMIELLTRYYK